VAQFLPLPLFCVLFALAPPFDDEPSLPCRRPSFWFCALSYFSRCSYSPPDDRLTPRHHRPLCASPSHQDRLSPFHISRASRLQHCLTSFSLPLPRSHSFGIAASYSQEPLPNSLPGHDDLAFYNGMARRLLYEYRIPMWRTVLAYYVSPRTLEY
jgi:hypothetical protein